MINKLLAFAAFFCLVAVTAVTAAHRPAPVLALDGDDLWVEVTQNSGAIHRVLIRSGSAGVEPGRTGWSPEGLAGFVTWNEADGRRWSAWSRDGGMNWSDGRLVDTRLMLHDRSVRPGLEASAADTVRLVRFRSQALPEYRSAVRAAGGELLQYFPNNAYIVRMDEAAAARVAGLSFVERIEPYHPSYRLEDGLHTWLESDSGEDRLRVRVVTFEWGPGGKERILAAAAGLGIEAAAYWPSGHILELWVDRDQLRSLAAHDEVQWIDRWTEPETDMDLVRQDAGTDWLETNHGYCGQGVNGEVMDAGIDGGHQDFDGVLFHGGNNVDSHGTSTYGIVFGNGNRDGDGNAQATGHMPCPEAQGIFADYGFLGDRFAHTDELKNAPYFASFQTNSWGGGRTTAYNSASQEMDDIIWRLDITITQSQSNAGNTQSRPQAWAKNIISVGGIRHYNTLDSSDDRWAGGASTGPALDGRIKPDVNYWYDSIYTTTTGGYTSGFGGTSAATPEVAGVLGLMYQMWSENVWNTNPVGATVFERQPHFSTMKALLINNANQYPFSGETVDLRRTTQGWGRPSVQVAMERAARSFIVDETELLSIGESATFNVNVLPGEAELKITMVYPDPPGTTSSTLHRINDVDLKVTSPGGTEYYGNNGLRAGNYSTPDGSPNTVDTVENVFIQNPESGNWAVEITAFEINQDAWLDTPGDDVSFALVVTGASGEAVCGNNEQEFGEDCDGLDLGGATCFDRGCTGGGALSCNVDCTYNTAACSECPVCGDGSCDKGEDCNGCIADCDSAPDFACGNGICETADGETCVTCPADCNNIQKGKPTNRYCCGDGVAGDNPVDCGDARCNGGGNTCTVLPALAYCCGDAVCEDIEDLGNCAADCTPTVPGEAGGGEYLQVTGFDAATGTLSISYGVPCAATDHTIEFGELTRTNLASYNWAGQECGLGNAGAYNWSTTGTPDAMFFVIVGNNGTQEGSYGADGDGQERLEDSTSGACPMEQNLAYTCN